MSATFTDYSTMTRDKLRTYVTHLMWALCNEAPTLRIFGYATVSGVMLKVSRNEKTLENEIRIEDLPNNFRTTQRQAEEFIKTRYRQMLDEIGEVVPPTLLPCEVM